LPQNQNIDLAARGEGGTESKLMIYEKEFIIGIN